jgi:hypothetical protein
VKVRIAGEKRLKSFYQGEDSRREEIKKFLPR